MQFKWAYDRFVFLTLILFYSVSASAALPKPGKFDYWVLAVSYMVDFCNTHPDKKECKDRTPNEDDDDAIEDDAVTFPGSGLVLHGLWPNVSNDPKHTYQYCELPKSQVEPNWCQPQTDIRSRLSGNVWSALSEVMPGVQSCLYNHEWYAHGSCSGDNAEAYYANASDLMKHVWEMKALRTLIDNSVGESVSQEEILDAIEEDLGAGSRDTIFLNCRKEKKKSYLAEIQIALDRDDLMSFPSKNSFAMSESDGNCPADGIQIAESKSALLKK